MASGNNSNITVNVPGYGERTGSVVWDGSQWLFYWNTITTTYSQGGGSGGGVGVSGGGNTSYSSVATGNETRRVQGAEYDY